jgi:hypothetical protein
MPWLIDEKTEVAKANTKAAPSAAHSGASRLIARNSRVVAAAVSSAEKCFSQRLMYRSFQLPPEALRASAAYGTDNSPVPSASAGRTRSPIRIAE